MFDDNLLTEFADTFFGYGTFSGKYWFVGMEEGGGNSEAEINRRLTAWQAGGKRAIEDVAEFHRRIGMPEFFAENPKLQTTWNKMIRLILGAKGQTALIEDVRAYQSDHLGQFSGETCLMELLPLPSPSTTNWLYDQYSALPQLRDRKAYSQYYAENRTLQITRHILEHSPTMVVFLGFRYEVWWRKIADTTFTEQRLGKHRLLLGQDPRTVFVIETHPVTAGVTNEYFYELGNRVAEAVKRLET